MRARPRRRPSQAALAMRHPMGRAVAKARIANKLRELLIHVHILTEGEECSLLLADAAWVLGIGTEVALAVHGPGSTDTRRLHATLRGLVQLALEGYRWKPYLTAPLDEALQLSSRLLVEHEDLAYDVMPGAEYLAQRLRTRCIDGSEVAGAEIYAPAAAAAGSTAPPRATRHHMNALTDLAHIQRAPIDGAITIPLELAKPSPTNPRKHFDQKKLDELADSIRKHTLMQPILVRPVDDARAGEPLYEIVAGERRWRASKLADTGTIMAICRPMSDFEVLELQLIENLQRDDLHPLEEAEGYQRLLRKPDGLQGYANAEELAARIGKSRSYVFQRLKLLDLCEAGRAAMGEGKISFSVALLIARLPKAGQQNDATSAIVQGWGGEPFTFRQASDYIQREFMLALDRAVFKITDATLLPEAGSCRDCCKRTGANPDLFDDVKKDDTCTDAACYHAKEAAHREQLKADAEQRGLEVVSGKDAKKAMPESWSNRMKGFLALDEVHLALGTKPLRKLLGKDLPEVLLFENPHTLALVEVVREREALDRLKASGKIKRAAMPSSGATERDNERKAKAETAWREEVARECVEAAAGNAGADAAYRTALLTELALVIWERLHSDTQRRAEKLLAWEHIGSEYASKGAGQRKEERIRALTDGELCRYFTATALAGEVYVGSYQVSAKIKPQRLLGLAERLGVDAESIRQRLRAETLARVKAGKPANATKTANGAAAKKTGADADAITPETALAAALKKAKSTPAKVAAKYRDPATGSTWSGRGLQPAWLKAALASGRTLPEFLVKNAAIVAAQTASATLSAAAADPFRTY